MANRKKPVELSHDNLRLVLKKTAEAVRAANLGRGIAMTVIENGEMIELHPDGSRHVIKKNLPLPVRVTKKRFTLE
jgi:hypothetical protein